MKMYYEFNNDTKEQIVETAKNKVAWGYEDYYCTPGNAPDGPKYTAVAYEKVRKCHDEHFPTGVSIDGRRIRELAFGYLDSGIGESTSDRHED